jgi:hypothetical protein
MANLATITTNILADSGIDDINVIVSTGSYADPAWITSLAWTKITGAPSNIVTGTGTTNFLPKFTGTSTIGNSVIQEASSNIGIGVSPSRKLHVLGGAGTAQIQSTGSSSIMYFGDASSSVIDNQGFGSLGNTLYLLAGGAERLYITSAGNVGIGTASPNYLLHIAAGAANPQLQFTSTGTGSTTSDGFHIGVNNSTLNAFLLQKENAALQFLTNDTERMRLDASGNLGLGVTPSAWYTGYTAMQIGESASLFSNRTSADTRTTQLANNAFLNSNASNWIYQQSDEATRYGQVSGEHQWYTAPSGTAGNAISFTQAMTLGSNSGLSIGTPSAAPSQGLLVQGNVGIGVSPDVKLDVLGTSDTSDVVRIRKSSTGSRRGALGTQSGVGCLDLYNDSTELNIRLLAQGNSYFNGGNVGIGITNPQADLHVFRSGSTASITTGLKVNHECNADDFVVFFTGNESLTNNRFVMTQPGNIGIGTASPQQALHVNGIVLLENNQSIRWFNNASAQRTLLTLDSNNDFQVGGSISNIRFLTNDSSERVRIFSNGNVFIGASPSDNGARLQVNGGDLRVQGNTNLGNSLGSTLSSTFTTRLSGFALRADVSNRYGNYGVLIINSDSGWTSSARRFMITNGIGANKFGIIRSVDANTDPALGDAGSIASGTVDFEINSTGAATFSSSVTAASIIRSGGTSSQYLMADGSVSTLSNPVTGTGSAGQVAYWSSGSAITGESNLFWDATNDRLGIGRNNPSQRLDILGSGTVYANIENSGANIAAVITKNTSKTFTTGLVTDYWAVIDSTSGSNTRLMIESGGNVLINTTTNVTGANLNVNGNIRTAAPTGGSAENWKLGNAVNGTVNANRLIRVEIAGVGYDLVARQII